MRTVENASKISNPRSKKQRLNNAEKQADTPLSRRAFTQSLLHTAGSKVRDAAHLYFHDSARLTTVAREQTRKTTPITADTLTITGGEIILGSIGLLKVSQHEDKPDTKEKFETGGTAGLAAGFVIFEAGMGLHYTNKTINAAPVINKIETALQKKTTRLPWRKNSR